METPPEQELAVMANTPTPLLVEHLDGTQETVYIKKLGIKHMDAYNRMANGREPDEAGVALLCIKEPKDREWYDSLTPESQLEIAEQGGELNNPLFGRFWVMKKRRLKAVGIDLDDAEGVRKATKMAQAANSPGPESSGS